MQKIVSSAKLRIVLLPLVGVLGTLAAIVWPVGYNAFCAGIGAGVA